MLNLEKLVDLQENDKSQFNLKKNIKLVKFLLRVKILMKNQSYFDGRIIITC